MRFNKRAIILFSTLLAVVLFFVIANLITSVFFNNPDNDKEVVPPPPPIIEEDPLYSIEIITEKFIKHSDGDVDLIAEIKNSNPDWGANEIFYKFNLMYSSGVDSSSVSGNSYILPGETKFILIPRISAKSTLSKVNFEIVKVEWSRVEDFVRLDLNINNIKLQQLGSESVFNISLSGILENNSLFGLTDIKVIALLMDSNDNIIAAGKTSLQTVLEAEKREIEIFWIDKINLSNVSDIFISAYSNILENESFINQYRIEPQSKPRGTDRIRRDDDYFELPEIFDRFRGWTF